MNAKVELLEHIADREVRYVHITKGRSWAADRQVIAGTLPAVLPGLDFEYDDGFGGQELFGHIWYTDGTWSERGEHYGAEWWEHKCCPAIPTVRQDAQGDQDGSFTTQCTKEKR